MRAVLRSRGQTGFHMTSQPVRRSPELAKGRRRIVQQKHVAVRWMAMNREAVMQTRRRTLAITAFIGTCAVAATGSDYDPLHMESAAETRVMDRIVRDAEHSAFTDRALPGDKMPRNPNHHRAILALSTAFWDAYLRGDEDALSWLRGDAVRGVLGPSDRWQWK